MSTTFPGPLRQGGRWTAIKATQLSEAARRAHVAVDGKTTITTRGAYGGKFPGGYRRQRDLTCFRFQILGGTDAGKVNILDALYMLGDPGASNTQYTYTATTTLTLTASKYNLAYVELTFPNTPVVKGLNAASVDACFAAMNQSETLALYPLHIFYRDGSSNVNHVLDCRMAWVNLAISAP